MKKMIKCKSCNGYYVVRDGAYGIFAGCSNYPKCKSTTKVAELSYEFILQYGINIYGWKKKCWKCKQDTHVYSYFLYYELEEVDDYFNHLHGIGLGDIPCVDLLVSKTISSIKMQYSKTSNSSYMANSCTYCNALQGRNYVVDDPHEIINELWHDHNMEKYLVSNLRINDGNLLSELRQII